jgi:ribosomal protein L11 methyltransferase
MNYVQVEIESFDQQEKEILVALLTEQGYEGFEEDAGTLKAFIAQKDFNETILRSVLRDRSFTTSVIEEKNWNQEWESHFQPVIIDDYCAIRAEFHRPIENVQHEIVITPKMSFGTGHHPTTEMMIRMMREIDFTPKKVLDFGTGTGVLAILAEKNGAEEILAIDNDDWSIENAKENFRNNDSHKIKIQQASAIPASEPFDIILANIIRSVIILQLEKMARALNKDGFLLLSGLLKEDENEILHMAKQWGLLLQKKIQQGNWICLMLQYEQHITSKLN